MSNTGTSAAPSTSPAVAPPRAHEVMSPDSLAEAWTRSLVGAMYQMEQIRKAWETPDDWEPLTAVVFDGAVKDTRVLPVRYTRHELSIWNQGPSPIVVSPRPIDPTTTLAWYNTLSSLTAASVINPQGLTVISSGGAWNARTRGKVHVLSVGAGEYAVLSIVETYYLKR